MSLYLTSTEPYDYASWCLILVFSVHASGAAIFVVEWLSPQGLDQGNKPIRGDTRRMLLTIDIARTRFLFVVGRHIEFQKNFNISGSDEDISSPPNLMDNFLLKKFDDDDDDEMHHSEVEMIA